ncbi:MAG: tyrosine recombinase XerC [Oscillospiraceae bacterium]|nr:tyrosine recombinase XerC [Oscillospiraceae bacterium]
MNEIWKESPEIIYRFLLYMQTVKGKSEKTINEYFFDLRTFFRFVKFNKFYSNKKIIFEEISIQDLSIDLIKSIKFLDVLEYINYLAKERGNRASSRSRKISSLRSFFGYLTIKIKVLDENPVIELETPKIKKALPKFLNLQESQNFLDTIKQHGCKTARRDYCMAVLFLNCGLRLSELVGINIQDLGDDDTLRVLGKGNKERIIYINKFCKDSIDNYKTINRNSKGALFLSRGNQRISTKTVQFLMKKYFKLAGLGNRGFSTHKLRHTAATLMYQHGGADIRVLKEILGHENIATTEVYTHTCVEQIKKAIQNNPLSNSRNLPK